MRPPITYYGGKTRMLDILIPMIPEHRVYVEAFAGGASLFWAKAKSKVEVLNDINRNVVNFYQVMNSQFDKLMTEIRNTLHCEETHKLANHIYHNPDGFEAVKRAWALWVSSNMSFGGELGSPNFKWVVNQADNWSPAVAINNRKLQFGIYKNRLEKVCIHSKKAERLIPKIDHEDVFFYLDPPYVGARQGHYEGYNQEHFDELLQILSKIKGKFLMSSYQNDQLTQCVKASGWNHYSVRMRKGISHKNETKTEVLTWNYELTLPSSVRPKTLSIF